MNEHTGTHFDAPVHWVSGRDVPNGAVDEIAPENFVGPVVVIDCSDGAAENDDFELTPEVIEAWEAEHGRIPEGAWVLMRTDWSKRSPIDYLNMRRGRAAFAGPYAGGRYRRCWRAAFEDSARRRSARTRGRARTTRRLIRRTTSCTARANSGCNVSPISICCRRPARS